MAWHRPRSRRLGVVFLRAIVAFDLASLPRSSSPGLASLTLVSAIPATVSGPLKRVEWTIIAVTNGP